MSTKERCGDKLGLDKARVLLMSPLFTYSRQDLTPCRSNRLKVGCGLESFGPCPTNREQRGCCFGRPCSSASTMPGAEMDPVTKAMPTGAKVSGGRALAARPAQKLWRSPATVTKPVMLFCQTKS